MADSTERDTKITIHQRIHAVMVAVAGLIEKDKTQIIRKDGKKVGEFDYISHDSVTAHIRKECLNNFIIPEITVIECKNNGNRVEMRVSVSFVNVDDSSDRVAVEAIGYGNDNQDKGPGKALSYAVKSAYLKQFMLNSADDVEGDNVDHNPSDNRRSETDAAMESVKQAREAAAKSLKLAIDGASTLAELKDLKKANADTMEAFPDVTTDYFLDQFKDREAALKSQEESGS